MLTWSVAVFGITRHRDRLKTVSNLLTLTRKHLFKHEIMHYGFGGTNGDRRSVRTPYSARRPQRTGEELFAASWQMMDNLVTPWTKQITIIRQRWDYFKLIPFKLALLWIFTVQTVLKGWVESSWTHQVCNYWIHVKLLFFNSDRYQAICIRMTTATTPLYKSNISQIESNMGRIELESFQGFWQLE